MDVSARGAPTFLTLFCWLHFYHIFNCDFRRNFRSPTDWSTRQQTPSKIYVGIEFFIFPIKSSKKFHRSSLPPTLLKMISGYCLGSRVRLLYIQAIEKKGKRLCAPLSCALQILVALHDVYFKKVGRDCSRRKST